MLVTLAMVWRFVRAPDVRRWLAAALVAVISVQCLFQNSFLLLALCAAAAAVSVRRTRFQKRAGRAGDRRAGGDVAAAVSRDYS